MLRVFVVDFEGCWDEHIPLVYFSYNNSYHSNISMASFEAFYSRRCRSPVSLIDVGESSFFGPDLIY